MFRSIRLLYYFPQAIQPVVDRMHT